MSTSPAIERNALLGATVVKNLKARGFDAFYCKDKKAALKQALKLIDKKKLLSWGGTVSIDEIGLLKEVRNGKYNVLDRDTAKTPEEREMMLRQALLSDVYFMSVNGMTESGELINIDGTGNRCAAMIYGPKEVIIVAGINKIAKDFSAAMARARGEAAPINIKRFPALKTPCQKTGVCADCLSNDSICNYFAVARRCRPAGRIKVILVGENLGF